MVSIVTAAAACGVYTARMSHSYCCNYLHSVFSTKERAPLIRDPHRLWEYVGGMARTKRVPLLAAGGTENHLHLLFNLPTTMTVAEAVQFFKGNTSRWMNETGGRFGWQEGYGAFSVSRSQRARVTRYIDLQIEHHKKWSFEDEFAVLLKSYDIAYDPQYVFGWPLPGLRHSPHGARGPQR